MADIRPARPADCPAIVSHVNGLARDIGVDVRPQVTAEGLQKHGFGDNPLLLLWVAESEGRIVGSTVANFMYSTWRGAAGIYVADLYVEPAARGGGIGERLLRGLVREAWGKGARFIRLDVDVRNEGAARFYARAGFHEHTDDRFFMLEAEACETFLAGA